MEIILLIVLLNLLLLVLYVLYRLVKWILRTKARRKAASFSILTLALGFTVYQLFFVKLEFIQSKVYPDLYLVDNFPEQRERLDQAIKDFVIQHIKENPTDTLPTLRFYEYSNNYTPLLFQDAGTAYFLENEEDLGGMIVEDFGMYIKLKLAVLEKTSCVDTSNYCAKLHYYEEGKMVKTENIKIILPAGEDQTK